MGGWERRSWRGHWNKQELLESKAEQGKSDEEDIRNCRSFKLRTDIESGEGTQPMAEHILCMQQIPNPISVTSNERSNNKQKERFTLDNWQSYYQSG